MKWLSLFIVVALGVFAGNMASHAVIEEMTAKRTLEAQREVLRRFAAAPREPQTKPARARPIRDEPILPPPDHPDAQRIGRACVNGLIHVLGADGKWSTLYSGGNFACRVREAGSPDS